MIADNVSDYLYELGQKDGHEQGREQGREEGREEERKRARLEKLEIIKGMLNDGVSLEKIKEYFILTDEELQSINN